jgi:branched-chain amino acid transport system ATP-binding protein
MVGLTHTDRRAETLSHGEQRQLEIAVALAMDPRILLLDEPLAGMGAEESARIADLIARIAETHAVMLVEHDMDVVFSIAHRLTVMVDGSVLACGTPGAIRQNQAVQEAYLGTAEDAA